MQVKYARAAVSLLSILSLTQNPGATQIQNSPSQNSALQDQQREAMRANFDTGRQLLLDKGVPFDPDELLRPGWTKSLKSTLDAMPEMHQVRHETAPLKGAYLADTLYLPEKVKLSGHTIIVANYVVFEGKNPVIRGSYDLNFFPAKPVVVLEATLAQVLHKQSAAVNIRWGDNLPSFSTIQQIVPAHGHLISIDTSGPEPQALRPAPHKPILHNATLRVSLPSIVPIQNCNTGCDVSGTSGLTGTTGTPGTAGAAGGVGAKGLDGNCSDPAAGSNNGVDGELAGTGDAGGAAGNGGTGGQGGNAGNINAMVQDNDLHTYNFIANGGTGGIGGEGGPGGPGGAGGKGGDAGNGVACGCQLGAGGRGGHGGSGGNGTAGGTGGQGGTGGNGGTITVSLPFNTTGAVTSNSGGNGGLGGGGGSGGIGGSSGSGGNGGLGATACLGTGANGSPGIVGFVGSTGGSGNAGPNGSTGAPGPNPSVTIRQPPGGGGGGLPDPCLDAIVPLGSNPADDYNAPDCSPIIIDTEGEGFHLTSAFAGVTFDTSGTGHPVQIAWTDANFHNAFLALPGQDGLVHNGKELFGNFSSQPQSPHPNGFLALAVYDKPENGGNGDGIIDEHDAIFAKLRLWIDSNHDGICQPEELHRLTELGMYSLSFAYVESRRTDEFGNQFRYRARVNPGERRDPRDQTETGDPGRWTYDVFLTTK
jgi:hypothetical protein